MRKIADFTPKIRLAAPKRKSLRKGVRFEIFKRDGFACQYCGAKPPAAILVIDHVHPVAKGGTDDPENLLTSCETCNAGKAAGLLNKVIPSAAEKAERIAEAEAQLAEYQAAMSERRDRENADIDRLQDVFRQTWQDRWFTEAFRESVRHNFLPKIIVADLVSYMIIACGRVDDPNRAIKYFCGICWKQIRGE